MQIIAALAAQVYQDIEDTTDDINLDSETETTSGGDFLVSDAETSDSEDSLAPETETASIEDFPASETSGIVNVLSKAVANSTQIC